MRRTLAAGAIVSFICVLSGLAAEETFKSRVSRDRIISSLSFREADVHDVLRTLAEQSGLNIMIGQDVEAMVTVELKNVTVKAALDAITAIHGLAYDVKGEIIRVMTLDAYTLRKQAEAKQTESMQTIALQEELITEVFELKYVDAGDVSKLLTERSSERGSMSVFRKTARGGWMVGAFTSDRTSRRYGRRYGESTETLQRERKKTEEEELSRILVVTDVQRVIEDVQKIIDRIDVPPKQVLIEARIVEVNLDDLKDIGVSWKSLGEEGATRPEAWIVRKKKTGNMSTNELSFDLTTMAVEPTIGLNLVFDRLSEEKLRAVLNALQTVGKARTLSAPRIMTLNNQEATILVGEKYPILATTVTNEGTVTEEFDRYEPIGISLRVIPQVLEGGLVNMVIHPTVSSLGEQVTGTTGLVYNRIDTREADTQVVVEDGETVVIAGLMRHKKEMKDSGIPFLRSIPILGILFRRRVEILKKTNLIIFITPHIEEEPMMNPGEILEFSRQIEMEEKRSNWETKRIVQAYSELADQYFAQAKYHRCLEVCEMILSLDATNSTARRYVRELHEREGL